MKLPPLPLFLGLEPDPGRGPPPPDDLRLRRTVADHLWLWARCPKPACRRAQRCRERTVPCFDIQRVRVVDAMNAFIYAGYRSDEDDDLD